MQKYEIHFKDENNKDFTYSVTAESIFEADERAIALSNAYGWSYIGI